jgi:hypothetical protein
MIDHVILLAPSSNRVYAGGADVLAAAELSILTRDRALEIEPIRIAGVAYLRLATGELDDHLRSAISRLSALFALFRRDGDRLIPIEVSLPDHFDDDLVTIPKYAGKTNEQFTRLLLNVTLGPAAPCRSWIRCVAAALP